jgi:hypothetical protein
MNPIYVDIPSRLILQPGATEEQTQPGGAFVRRSDAMCHPSIAAKLWPRKGMRDPFNAEFTLTKDAARSVDRSGMIAFRMESAGLPSGKIPSPHVEAQLTRTSATVPTIFTNLTSAALFVDITKSNFRTVTVGDNLDAIKLSDPQGTFWADDTVILGQATFVYASVQTRFVYVSKKRPTERRYANTVLRVDGMGQIESIEPNNYAGVPVIVRDIITTEFSITPFGAVYECVEVNQYIIRAPNRATEFTSIAF